MVKLNKTRTTAAMPSEDHRRYMAEDAMRTLSRAEAIRKDASLMRDVRALAETALHITGTIAVKPTSTKKPKAGNGRAGLELGNKMKAAQRDQGNAPSKKINPLASKGR